MHPSFDSSSEEEESGCSQEAACEKSCGCQKKSHKYSSSIDISSLDFEMFSILHAIRRNNHT